MKIRMFTSKSCPKCAMAKNFLEANGYKYEPTFVDNFNDEQMTELIKKSGGLMVLPLIFVSKDENADEVVLSGMDFRKIKEMV